MTDLISREDAEMCLTADITDMTIEEYISMVGDRLKGLSSIQPTAKENLVVEDCISRQAVLEFIGKQIDHSLWAFEKLVNGIKALPPVTPKPKTGHWIAEENEEMEIVGYFCSECDLPMETEEKTSFCPNCGAKMESEDKE